MLNNDTLNQLVKLKKDIQASKEYATGTVVGSNGRFGFVRLDDGRDAFLPPEKMARVIPGDTVKVSLRKNAKDKLEADLEKLITQSLDRFIGQYRIKGNAHFVQPSGQQSGRWIFLPPKSRGKCKEGDYVVARLLNHPFRDGKPSAKILDKIGAEQETKFELKYIKAKYNIQYADAQVIEKQSKEIEKQFAEEAFGDRTDLTDVPFVTIDSANTKDMDDALAIEIADDQSHIIHVAIADPSKFVAQDSSIGKDVFSRGQTVYLPGGSVPMFSAQLSHYCFSLEPNKKRPALVCHMHVNKDGEIEKADFEFAVIESKHKLAYDDVAAYLDSGEEKIPEDAKEMLKELKRFAIARRQYRSERYILPQEQPDYDYQLDEKGHLASIVKKPRNVAHQIVEESMLATNISAAELLAKHKVGIAVTHKGFRKERLGEVKALLKEEQVQHDDINALEEHVALFRKLENDTKTQPIVAPLKRMMDNTELSASFSPHLGMGLSNYATMTSPIRRYADLYNHWALQFILLETQLKPIDESTLQSLNETLQKGKQADRELFQWLMTIYAKEQIGYEGVGKIRIVTQHGFGVKLDENGLEGFVLFPKDTAKKHDAKRMTLSVGDNAFFLGMEVKIKVKSVDMTKKRVAFTLVDA